MSEVWETDWAVWTRIWSSKRTQDSIASMSRYIFEELRCVASQVKWKTCLVECLCNCPIPLSTPCFILQGSSVHACTSQEVRLTSFMWCNVKCIYIDEWRLFWNKSRDNVLFFSSSFVYLFSKEICFCLKISDHNMKHIFWTACLCFTCVVAMSIGALYKFTITVLWWTMCSGSCLHLSDKIPKEKLLTRWTAVLCTSAVFLCDRFPGSSSSRCRSKICALVAASIETLVGRKTVRVQRLVEQWFAIHRFVNFNRTKNSDADCRDVILGTILIRVDGSSHLVSWYHNTCHIF